MFNAKLRRYLPESEPVSVQLYFYFINDVYEADLMVDVSPYYDRKMAALRAYASQFDPADGANGYVKTPLNQGYLERIEARDRLLGQKRLVEVAEGFVTKLPYLIDRFM